MQHRKAGRLLSVILPISGLLVTARAVIAEPEPAAEAVPWTRVEDHWYVLEVLGQPAGWQHVLIESDGMNYRSTESRKLNVARGSTKFQDAASATFFETTEGDPRRMTIWERTGQHQIEQEWIFEADSVKHIIRQGGQETTEQLPLSRGDWLTPMAATKLSEERRRAGVQEFSYHAINPAWGISPIDVKVEFTGNGEANVGERTLPVTIWKTTTSLRRLEYIEQITEDGDVVRSEMQSPGLGMIVARLVTKKEALAADKAPAPEIMVRSFVRPDKPIKDVDHSTAVKMRVMVMEGSMLPLPSAGAQTAEMSQDGISAILTVDLRTSAADPIDEDKRREYLESSAMVDANNALVKDLTARAVAESGSTDVERAGVLRRYVHDYVLVSDMATALASASETARTRAGDCTGKAVLLCAMLRANGIPARIATGLIYDSEFCGERDIFAWHMWTQALINGHWIDYDATLSHRFHAGHVLTNVSSLSDQVASIDLASDLRLFGNLKIEVLEVRYQ